MTWKVNSSKRRSSCRKHAIFSQSNRRLISPRWNSSKAHLHSWLSLVALLLLLLTIAIPPSEIVEGKINPFQEFDLAQANDPVVRVRRCQFGIGSNGRHIISHWSFGENWPTRVPSGTCIKFFETIRWLVEVLWPSSMVIGNPGENIALNPL